MRNLYFFTVCDEFSYDREEWRMENPREQKPNHLRHQDPAAHADDFPECFTYTERYFGNGDCQHSDSQAGNPEC